MHILRQNSPRNCLKLKWNNTDKRYTCRYSSPIPSALSFHFMTFIFLTPPDRQGRPSSIDQDGCDFTWPSRSAVNHRPGRLWPWRWVPDPLHGASFLPTLGVCSRFYKLWDKIYCTIEARKRKRTLQVLAFLMPVYSQCRRQVGDARILALESNRIGIKIGPVRMPAGGKCEVVSIVVVVVSVGNFRVPGSLATFWNPQIFPLKLEISFSMLLRLVFISSPRKSRFLWLWSSVDSIW